MRVAVKRLYPYQTRAVLDCMRHLRTDRRTLLVAPTGSGKTVMAAAIARRFHRALLVAHRIEIVAQAKALGIRALTLAQALALEDVGIDLLIIDEAHRAAAKTYREIVRKYKNATLLGLTATPRRTDGQGLCDAFDEMVISSSIADLVARWREDHTQGLVPHRALEAPDEALEELRALRQRGGDYATGELANVMDRPRLVGDVVREYQKHALGRKTICFAVSVGHSIHLAAAFQEEGIRAAHLDGRCSAKLRSELLAKLSNGDIDVLCNVNLFTEGWDCPPVSCVIMARPTTSLTLYLQSVGRGMRPAPGKDDLLVLDHAGNIEAHGAPDQVREWSLESNQQKAKRLAEVAELERLHSLGFESIEAELEEKKRFREATYTGEEAVIKLASAGLDNSDKRLYFLNKYGIVNVGKGKGRATRYLRDLIDAALEKYAAASVNSYSLSELQQQLQKLANDGQRFHFMKKHGISPIGRGKQVRYPRDLVDAAIAKESLASVYTHRQLAELGLVKKGRFTFLKRHRIPNVGRVNAGCYPRDLVDAALTKEASSYTADQLARFGLDTSPKRVWFLKKHGIRNVAGSSQAARYPRDLVDAALAKEGPRR